MNSIFIKTQYVEDLGRQAFAVVTGLLLNRCETPVSDSFNLTTPHILTAVLTGKKPTDADLQVVNKGLRDLLKEGLVEKYCNGHYLVRYDLIEQYDERYVCLDKKEVRAIINSKEEVNRLSLLQYFAYLKSTFDFKTGIGCLPISYYAEGSGVHEQTIYKYHRALENLGVLKVFRFAAVPTPGGLVRRQINIYCTPDNESAAIQYLKDHGKYSHLISAEDTVDPDFGNPDLIPDEAIPEALR